MNEDFKDWELDDYKHGCPNAPIHRWDKDKRCKYYHENPHKLPTDEQCRRCGSDYRWWARGRGIKLPEDENRIPSKPVQFILWLVTLYILSKLFIWTLELGSVSRPYE